MTFDYKILEEKMRQLSPEMQSALTSVEISQAIQDISKKYELKIDQEGVLFDHTAYVMLGLLPSKDFVKEFTKEAQIDEKKVQLIAEDVNANVFDKIRRSMRQIEDLENESSSEKREISPQSTISSIEQAGGFSIEKEVSTAPKKTRPDGSWKMPEDGELELPEEILKHIEEFKPPVKVAPISTPTPVVANVTKIPLVTIPVPTPKVPPMGETVTPSPIKPVVQIPNPPPTPPVKSSWEKDNERHVEPLIDHLLTKPTSIPLEKSSQHIAEIPHKSIPPPNNIPTGPNMYREPIE